MGLTVMQKENMLLHFITAWSNKFFAPEKITWAKYYLAWALKPVYRCPPCMSSIHGAIVYILVSHLFNSPISVLTWLIIAGCSVPIVYILNEKI